MKKNKEKKLPLWIKIVLLIVIIFYLYYILVTPYLGDPKIPPAPRNK